MHKRSVWILAVLLVCALAAPLSAQEVTQTPEGSMSGDMGSIPMLSDVTRVQIGHFAPDAPPVVVYVDGQPTMEALSYPALTGWIEMPATSINLMLVPEGAAEDQAVLGPVTISNTMGGWMTLIVAGSAANGTLGLYALNQPTGGLAPNCARVVVFHGIENGPGVDLQGADGVSLGANLMFPGSMTGAMSTQEADATGSMANNLCSLAVGGDMTATQEAGMGDMGMSGTMRDYGQGESLSCSLIASMNMSGDTLATQDASLTSTQEAGAADSPVGGDAGAMMGTYDNCAYVFDVPAGAGTFGAYTGGSLLADFATTEFTANTYTFAALIGTADAPQVFTFTLPGADVDAMLASEQERMGQTGGTMPATEEATQEAGGSG